MSESHSTACLYLDSLFGSFLCTKDRAALLALWLWLVAEYHYLVQAWRTAGDPACDSTLSEFHYPILELTLVCTPLWTDTNDGGLVLYPVFIVYAEPPNEYPDPVVQTLPEAMAEMIQESEPLLGVPVVVEPAPWIVDLYVRVPHGKRHRYVLAEKGCGEPLYKKVKGRYLQVS